MIYSLWELNKLRAACSLSCIENLDPAPLPWKKKKLTIKKMLQQGNAEKEKNDGGQFDHIIVIYISSTSFIKFESRISLMQIIEQQQW